MTPPRVDPRTGLTSREIAHQSNEALALAHAVAVSVHAGDLEAAHAATEGADLRTVRTALVMLATAVPSGTNVPALVQSYDPETVVRRPRVRRVS